MAKLEIEEHDGQTIQRLEALVDRVVYGYKHDDGEWTDSDTALEYFNSVTGRA